MLPLGKPLIQSDDPVWRCMIGTVFLGRDSILRRGKSVIYVDFSSTFCAEQGEDKVMLVADCQAQVYFTPSFSSVAGEV